MLENGVFFVQLATCVFLMLGILFGLLTKSEEDRGLSAFVVIILFFQTLVYLVGVFDPGIILTKEAVLPWAGSEIESLPKLTYLLKDKNILLLFLALGALTVFVGDVAAQNSFRLKKKELYGISLVALGLNFSLSLISPWIILLGVVICAIGGFFVQDFQKYPEASVRELFRSLLLVVFLWIGLLAYSISADGDNIGTILIFSAPVFSGTALPLLAFFKRMKEAPSGLKFFCQKIIPGMLALSVSGYFYTKAQPSGYLEWFAIIYVFLAAANALQCFFQTNRASALNSLFGSVLMLACFMVVRGWISHAIMFFFLSGLWLSLLLWCSPQGILAKAIPGLSLVFIFGLPGTAFSDVGRLVATNLVSGNSLVIGFAICYYLTGLALIRASHLFQKENEGEQNSRTLSTKSASLYFVIIVSLGILWSGTLSGVTGFAGEEVLNGNFWLGLLNRETEAVVSGSETSVGVSWVTSFSMCLFYFWLFYSRSLRIDQWMSQPNRKLDIIREPYTLVGERKTPGKVQKYIKAFIEEGFTWEKIVSTFRLPSQMLMKAVQKVIWLTNYLETKPTQKLGDAFRTGSRSVELIQNGNLQWYLWVSIVAVGIFIARYFKEFK